MAWQYILAKESAAAGEVAVGVLGLQQVLQPAADVLLIGALQVRVAGGEEGQQGQAGHAGVGLQPGVAAVVAVGPRLAAGLVLAGVPAAVGALVVGQPFQCGLHGGLGFRAAAAAACHADVVRGHAEFVGVGRAIASCVGTAVRTCRRSRTAACRAGSGSPLGELDPLVPLVSWAGTLAFERHVACGGATTGIVRRGARRLDRLDLHGLRTGVGRWLAGVRRSARSGTSGGERLSHRLDRPAVRPVASAGMARAWRRPAFHARPADRPWRRGSWHVAIRRRRSHPARRGRAPGPIGPSM